MERSEQEEPQERLRADTDGDVQIGPSGADGLSGKGDDSLTPPLRRASADEGAADSAGAGSALRVPSLNLPKASTEQRRSNGARTLSLAA